jgi:hypothetical protein
VVLLVLALAWGTVLIFWFRSRSQDTLGDSVGLFHRHLNVLQKAAPATLAPANRLRVPEHHTPFSPRRAALGQTIPRPVTARGAVPRGSGAQLLAQTRMRQTRRRRRDVLFMLVILCVATFAVAAVLRTGPTIVAQLTIDIVLVSYIAMLVRIRNIAAERDIKLRVMYPQQQVQYQARPVRQARPRPARQAAPRPRPRPVAQAEYGYDYGYSDQYEDTGSYSLPGYGLAAGS